MKTRLSIPRTISRLVRVRRATQMSGLVIQSMPARYAERWPPRPWERSGGSGVGGPNRAGQMERCAGDDHRVHGVQGRDELRPGRRGPVLESDEHEGDQGEPPGQPGETGRVRETEEDRRDQLEEVHESGVL